MQILTTCFASISASQTMICLNFHFATRAIEDWRPYMACFVEALYSSLLITSPNLRFREYLDK